ncbi:MAG: SH3 domain-containing protein [Dehalococcoidia bacterium]
MSLPFTGGGRRCGTCRFYRSSPIPGQGWCTHPELVKPPAMVLVKSRELNCSRPLSEVPDRWEPVDPRHDYPARPSQRIRAVAAAEPESPTVETAPVYSVTRNEQLPDVNGETEPMEPIDDAEPPAGEAHDGQDHGYQQSEPFPEERRSGGRLVWLMLVPIVLCLLLGIGGAVGFVSTGGFGTGLLQPASVSPTRPAGVAGTAKQDFRLRSEPRSDSEQRSVVRAGTRLQLINSAGGEVLDPALPEPSKWYLVQTADGAAQGWAYSGWIDRSS